MGLYIGWGVRAGCRVDVLGWACLDNACTSLWVNSRRACLWRYNMYCDCFLLGGRVWLELTKCRAFTSDGEAEWDVELMYSDGLAWIMLEPRCGRILSVLVCGDTRDFAIASCLGMLVYSDTRRLVIASCLVDKLKGSWCTRLLERFCFNGRLRLYTGNQIYISCDLEPKARGYRVHTGYVLLLTLSVLLDNDAVVEIEFPVPDRLPESAEAPISIASVFRFTCGISYFRATLYHAVFGDARYLAIASCLVDGFHWSTTSNRQTGRESGMLSWSYLDLLAWIMLAPCCGYILDVLVHDDTRCLAIASCLVEGFGRN
ncbi:hypothetical protein E5676_scaffold447G00850 [Cucumis melo var. makuwa]|uniref:Uncharacterized protein n=1 Tax=Cucumis melo var. makuwa TaxID=1194695 RepID=A0A5A7SJC7_CUCMM|nr:hypothetical protein E6C27_scaffold34G00210 [Cucumis melo var. makuwa]TYK09680.1 hypothetical protein E5676_scaffold447G00850 [Cucumis melo var. makuwa]